MLVELLIRVEDKTNPDDKYADAMCSKAGDVIWWKKSPGEWGIDEVKLPFYRIVKADLTEVQCDMLIALEIKDKAQPNQILRRRQMGLDMASLEVMTKGAMSVDQTAKIEAIDTLIAPIELAKVVQLSLQDYAIALVNGELTSDDLLTKEQIMMKQAVVDQGKIAAESTELKEHLATNAVDADVSDQDLFAIASLKKLMVDEKLNVIGPEFLDVIG